MNISISVADILRYFCLVQACFLTMFGVLSILRYGRKIYKPESDRALPAHVTLIAFSYLGFIWISMIELWRNFGLAMTWRLPCDLIFLVLGDGAMIFLIIHLSVKRMLIRTVLDQARKETEDQLTRERALNEQRMSGMQRIAQNTSDSLQELREETHTARDTAKMVSDLTAATSISLAELREETTAAKNTAKEVSDKADAIGETSEDTNVRVRDIQERNGGNK